MRVKLVMFGVDLAAERGWLDGCGGGQTPEGETGARLVLAGAGVQSLVRQ